MNIIYKKTFSIVGAGLLLIGIAGIQTSLINSFFIPLNLFLVLVLYLILVKNNTAALIFSWLGGMLIDLSKFQIFGASSLVLLFLTALLIAFYKTMFSTLRMENVLLTGAGGVGFYHFLSWIFANLLALFKIGAFEKFGFYFFNFSFVIELILTALLLLLIFKIKRSV